MLSSAADLIDLHHVRGHNAPAEPNLLFEAPHGATSLDHYRTWEARLRSELPADLQCFFTMNTDVGSTELAMATADQLVKLNPTAHVLVMRCCLPRTFIDVNRTLDEEVGASGLTRGLPVYIDHPSDHQRLLEAHAAYTAQAETAYETVLDGGGAALIFHTYGPRTLPIQSVGHDIVDQLRWAHEPHQLASAPLRAEVDLITTTPDGTHLAHTGLEHAVVTGLRRANFDVQLNHTYQLHPASMAYRWSAKWPGRILALEFRRDLLVEKWVWDQPMAVDTQRVQRAVHGLLSHWPS